jgi:hypothetical protein
MENVFHDFFWLRKDCGVYRLQDETCFGYPTSASDGKSRFDQTSGDLHIKNDRAWQNEARGDVLKGHFQNE